MEKSDLEYVEHCRNGQPEDYRFLVERYQGPVFGYLSGLLGDATLAQDAAQESFVRGYFALAKLKKPGSFHAWLLGIAGRVAKEYRRAAHRLERQRQAAEVSPTSEPETGGEQRLAEALAALPESPRQVILLRYYEDLSCQEVADRFGMPLGTVTKTLSRGYAQLRQILSTNPNLSEEQ